MNADHNYTEGRYKRDCQDYALSGTIANGAYAFVTAGNSSLPQSDFGARALALSAKRTLMLGGHQMKYDLFGKITIKNLEHIGDNIPLDPHSLDACLLTAWVKNNEFVIHIFGDGIWFHKTPTTLRIVKISFESGQPAYLSYYLDKLRLKEYEGRVIGSKHISDIALYTGPGAGDGPDDAIEIETYVDPFSSISPVSFRGNADDGDIIGVCSDGVNSFKTATGAEIPWQSIVRSFTDYKSVNGTFVRRNHMFLNYRWIKDSIFHSDDVSVAAISV